MKKFIRHCWMAVLLTAILICPSSLQIECAEIDIPHEHYAATLPAEIEPNGIEEEPFEEIVIEEVYEPVITEYDSEESEDYIWEQLSLYSPNDEITAGIMGYFYRESKMRSDSVAGWPERNLWQETDICEDFTKLVDDGLHDGSSKEYFKEMTRVHYGGYGLGQWSADCYLDHYYEFVREREGSIADAALQCEFIFESLQENEELWEELLKCTTAYQTGRRIALYYDGTSHESAEGIAHFAAQYHKTYAI